MSDTAMTRQTAQDYVDRLARRDWPGLAGLLADVVYEMPQTRERIRGRGRVPAVSRRAANTSWSGGEHRVLCWPA
ncbi:hypothetical protein [Micromonospora chersina]|uniref:hypothetical protein n=1 Tax=Micromonospora chersina TaxID=47854 RepID=UPI00340B1F5F